MPSVVIDGIETYYETQGEGPAILMFAPGGFDARIEKWSDLGVYARIRLLDHLPKHYQCILFDRRENGRSGGRVERITWDHYVRQGIGLLDHLGIEKAHMLGGCMGCCPVVATGVAHPDRVTSMVLYWPVGGAKFRMNGHMRFGRHLAFVEEQGLDAVVALVKSHDKNFSADPRGGPWGDQIRRSEDFARSYASQKKEDYIRLVTAMYRGLLDRDTAPGAEPEDMLRLAIPTMIIPGADGSHATSAARYLQECLEGSEYWDIPVDGQTAEATGPKVLDFLSRVGG